MESKNPFIVVTAELLKQFTLRHYCGNRELKEGDLIISALTIYAPTSTGVQFNSFTLDEACSMNMLLFVLDKERQILHQLYNQI